MKRLQEFFLARRNAARRQISPASHSPDSAGFDVGK